MTHHDKEPGSYPSALELSNDEIRSLFTSLAGVMILKGKITVDSNDTLPLEGETSTYQFTLDIPKEVIRSIYLGKHDDEAVIGNGHIDYLPPHIVVGSHTRPTSNMIISYDHSLGNSSTRVHETVWFSEVDGSLRCEIDTEYYEADGWLIDPVTMKPFQADSDEAALEARAVAHELLNRKPELDDAQKIRRLIEYIDSVPTTLD